MISRKSIVIYVFVILVVVLGVSNPIFGKGKLFEGFGEDFKGNPIWVILFLILAALVIVGLIVYNRIRKTRLDRENQIKKWLKFDEAARQRGLNKFEQELLKNMLTLSKINKINAVFKSSSLYEQLVDHALEQKRPANIISAIGDIRKKLGHIPLQLNQAISSTRQLEVQHLIKCKVTNQYESSVSIVKIETINEENWEILFQEKIDDRFTRQDEVKVFFNRDNDGEYSLRTRILNNARSGYSLILAHTTDITRVQLREYVRVSTRLPIQATVMNQSDKSGPKKDIHKGHALDICGGGIKADFPISFVEGTQLKLKIDWGSSVMDGIKTKVVCAEPWRSDSKDSHIVHLKFVSINSIDQAKIIKHVYQSEVPVQLR